MDSSVGLIIQVSGVAFITIFLYLLTRSLKSSALANWKKGWLSLLIGLFSLQLALVFKDFNKLFLVIYFLGEYIFGYFLIVGCYAFTTDKVFPYRGWYFGIGAILTAFFLAFSTSFDIFLNFHTFIVGTIFSVALFLLRKVVSSRKGLGWWLMRFSLALLAIKLYHHTLFFILDKSGYQLPIPPMYLMLNPIIDLMFEILLGFGMVIFLMEKVQYDLKDANTNLKIAHQKLKELVHIDPLTDVSNRHAFYGFLKNNELEEVELSGCVGFFDIDNMKPINDGLGHQAGDLAIQSVAQAIRSLVRKDDLIFRWGGDEFFVIMLEMSEESARQRMSNLEDLLRNIEIENSDQTLTVKVSYGFNDFYGVQELESSIKIADEKMYQNKQNRKQKINAVIHSISHQANSRHLSA